MSDYKALAREACDVLQDLLNLNIDHAEASGRYTELLTKDAVLCDRKIADFERRIGEREEQSDCYAAEEVTRIGAMLRGPS
jgi:hypothetical protein